MQVACGAIRLSRAAFYRPAAVRVGHEQPVIDASQHVVATKPRWGYWQCFYHLRFVRRPWNHKRVHRSTARSGSICPAGCRDASRRGCDTRSPSRPP